MPGLDHPAEDAVEDAAKDDAPDGPAAGGIYAMLFDMDGTLCDTDPIHHEEGGGLNVTSVNPVVTPKSAW
jgi:hypothetical protein